MKNFQARIRKSGTSYRYLLPIGPGAREGIIKNVAISIYYELGGMSYFTSQQSQRGAYVSLRVLETDDRDDRFESFMMFDGLKALLEPMGRKSDKKLALLAVRYDERLPEAAAIYRDGGMTKEAASAAIRHILNKENA